MVRCLWAAFIAVVLGSAPGCREAKPTPVRMDPKVLEKRTPKLTSQSVEP
jgi:hypothetical protein